MYVHQGCRQVRERENIGSAQRARVTVLHYTAVKATINENNLLGTVSGVHQF